jgi:hypothetical protein
MLELRVSALKITQTANLCIAECSNAVQEVVVRLLGVIKDPHTAHAERQRALMTIADALFPNSESGEYGMDLVASAA